MDAAKATLYLGKYINIYQYFSHLLSILSGNRYKKRECNSVEHLLVS
jgi:hypothetical protein